jgi:hypothetical protein
VAFDVRVGISGGLSALAITACVGLSAAVAVGGPGRAQPAYATPSGFYQKVAQAQVPSTEAVFVGDDYTAGTEGLLSADTFAALTCERLRWVCNVDAESGTGYVSNGHTIKVTHSPYLDRLPYTARTYAADVVVVSGGRNDGATGRGQQAIGAYLRAVRRAFPQAKVVALGPFWDNADPPLWLTRQRGWVQDAAESSGACYVDTDGWLKPTLIAEGTIQPTADGQSAIAARLVGELKKTDDCGG